MKFPFPLTPSGYWGGGWKEPLQFSINKPELTLYFSPCLPLKVGGFFNSFFLKSGCWKHWLFAPSHYPLGGRGVWPWWRR